MKILANDGISEAGAERLQSAGHEVFTDKVAQEDLANYINTESIDVLLVRSATTVRKDLIDACPGLKMIGRGGVGMDNIDVDYAHSKGLKIFNTPGASSQAVAELVMSHLFSIARSLNISNRKMPLEGDQNFSTLKKEFSKGFELRGKTLGIIGFGRIGQNTAKYALGIGMKVIAFDRVPMEVSIPIEIQGKMVTQVQIQTVELNELLREADVISLNVPKQEDGSPVIGEKEMGLMNDGVILINTSRGGTIDEAELLKAIESGKVRSAALDVYENEPKPSKDLLKAGNLSLSPHIGAATQEAQDRIGLELADFIIENA